MSSERLKFGVENSVYGEAAYCINQSKGRSMLSAQVMVLASENSLAMLLWYNGRKSSMLIKIFFRAVPHGGRYISASCLQLASAKFVLIEECCARSVMTKMAPASVNRRPAAAEISSVAKSHHSSTVRGTSRGVLAPSVVPLVEAET